MNNHIPVLMNEVIEGLSLHSGATVIDATVGLGGHAEMILARTSPDGKLIGFDRDDRNLSLAKDHLAPYADRITLINDSFGNMAEHSLGEIDAILFDLGFSSVHVDDAGRGFSFQQEGPLDMRYDQKQELTAETIINSWTKDELADLFYEYADETRSRQIAEEIVKARKVNRITTTTQLAEVIESVVKRSGKTHPATKVFQALRMAVNDELGEIKKGIYSGINLLKPGGRMAIITFHSTEDAFVKYQLKDDPRIELVNKKVIKPTYEETQSNPRSRSAKLRVVEKI